MTAPFRLWASHLLLAVLLLCPLPVSGGAWLREEGSTYLSFSYEAPQDGDGWASLYGERGLRERLTVGVIAGRSAVVGEGEVIAFVRRPSGENDEERRWVAATELGIGARFDEAGSTAPAVRLGGSLGRGLDTPIGPGWVALDASTTLAIRQRALGVGDWRDLEPVLKLDATLGVRPGEGNAVTMQLFYSQEAENEAAIRLVPSISRRIRGNTYGRIGLVVGSGAAPGLGAIFGLTTEF